MKLWKNYLLGDMQAIYLTETDPDYPDRKNMELQTVTVNFVVIMNKRVCPFLDFELLLNY